MGTAEERYNKDSVRINEVFDQSSDVKERVKVKAKVKLFLCLTKYDVMKTY
jgi:hypothetical protein